METGGERNEPLGVDPNERALEFQVARGKGLSQSPRAAFAIAHTRTRRDYYL